MNIFRSELTNKQKLLLIEITGLFIIIFFSVFIGYLTGLANAELERSDDIEKLDDYGSYEVQSTVYDIHNEKITEFILHKRKIVSFNQFPENLINALIAMEDNRFYDHKGIDVYSIIRAMVKNMIAMHVVEGGSTVTQQLAKLTFTDRKRNFQRKIKELWLAFQIENRYTKNEIIEKYFNQIFYNHGIYGVEAASQFYFGKSVHDLTVAESAMLVAIPPRPNKYSPIKYPATARKKQSIVLEKMVTQGYVTPKHAKQSLEEFWINFNNRLVQKDPRSALADRLDKAPYFSEYVRQFVEEYFKKNHRQTVEREIKEHYPNLKGNAFEEMVDKKIREHLFTGGFDIYTTLDLKRQRVAHKALSEQLVQQEKIFKEQYKHLYKQIRDRYTDLYDFIGVNFGDSNHQFKYRQKLNKLKKELYKEANSLKLIANVNGIDNISNLIDKHKELLEDQDTGLRPEGALVSIDPSNGHIVAMVGGRKFSKRNQLNRVFAKRQPGSAFKAFVYGAAMSSGKYSPGSIEDDEKLSFFDRNTKQFWNPGNADGKYRGPVTLKTAIQYSINTVAVKVVKKIGPEHVVQFAAPMMEIDESRFRSDMSIALGTTELTPFEMCTGMAVYANEGKKVHPIGVIKIIDRNGNVVKDFEKERLEKIREEAKNEKLQVITKTVALVMTNLLANVINAGTGTAANIGRPAAGKTGTTQDARDVWFVGFTPNLATAVWVGFDKGGMSLGHNQFGGSVAAPVWAKFMKFAHKNLPVRNFNYPQGIFYAPICKETGLRPSPECYEIHKVVVEMFLPGSYPKKTCRGDKISKNVSKSVDKALKEIDIDAKDQTTKKDKGNDNLKPPIQKDIVKHFKKNDPLVGDVIMLDPTQLDKNHKNDKLDPKKKNDIEIKNDPNDKNSKNHTKINSEKKN